MKQTWDLCSIEQAPVNLMGNSIHMRILITGANGQLGRSLQKALRDDDLILATRPTFDVTRADIIDKITSLKPDIVIHSAAKTDVDECEFDPKDAFLVNAYATQLVASACSKCNAKLAYISTDYVFDGKKGKAYKENDLPNPQNVYGKTKLVGEKYVQELVFSHYIIRTAWLYGDGKTNFVKKMLTLAKSPPIRVVTTQTGSPTSTDDLAIAINSLIQLPTYGIYHLTNEGTCSRYEMAKAIFEYSGLGRIPIEPIETYPRPALIPSCIVLDNVRAAQLGITMRPWQDALRAYVSSLTNPRERSSNAL